MPSLSHAQPLTPPSPSVGKTNITYIAWVFGTLLVAEGIYGCATDAVWAASNKGKTFDSVDWTKFIVEDDEEEEEDE